MAERKDRVLASLRFMAVARGVVLRTRCPRGYRVRLVEWIPAGEHLLAHLKGVSLTDRTLAFSHAVQARQLIGQHASSTHEQVVGIEIETPCRGRSISISWLSR
jgi:hypothetical protein